MPCERGPLARTSHPHNLAPPNRLPRPTASQRQCFLKQYHSPQPRPRRDSAFLSKTATATSQRQPSTSPLTALLISTTLWKREILLLFFSLYCQLDYPRSAGRWPAPRTPHNLAPPNRLPRPTASQRQCFLKQYHSPRPRSRRDSAF